MVVVASEQRVISVELSKIQESSKGNIPTGTSKRSSPMIPPARKLPEVASILREINKFKGEEKRSADQGLKNEFQRENNKIQSQQNVHEYNLFQLSSKIPVHCRHHCMQLP